MVDDSSASLDSLFRALADPTRRGILGRLARGGREMSVGELARPYDMSLAAVSKHVKALEAAGLVERAVQGREHRLRLRPERLADGHQWLGFYERFWNQRLDALADMLGERGGEKGEG